MTGVHDLLVPLAQLGLLVLGAPLFAGAVTTLRARLVGRSGPPLLRPYRELVKRLLEADAAPGNSLFHDLPAAVTLAATVTAAGLVPLTTTTAPIGAAGGALALVGLLLLARVSAGLGALASGSALAARGAARAAVKGALLEPALLVALAAVSLGSGTAELGRIAEDTSKGAGLLDSPGLVFAAAAIAIVVVVETVRSPRPGPETLTELSLVDEAMALDASGPRLAALELAAQVRALALAALFVNVFFPWGIARGTGTEGLGIGLLAIAAKLGVATLALGVSGAGLARLRLLRLPELAGTAMALGLLALVFVSIHGGAPR